MKRLSLLFVMGYMVSASVAQAATYYVSKSGNNANSCATAQNVNTPKATFTGGAGGLACLKAGDTLLVRAGTYAESIHSVVPGGTSWSNKVRIANYNGETVWLKPPAGDSQVLLIQSFGGAPVGYIEFDGINLDGTLQAGRNGAMAFSGNSGNGLYAHHIRFKNAEVFGGATGIANIQLGGGSPANQGSHELQNIVVHGGGEVGPGCAGVSSVLCSSYGVYIHSPNNLVENSEFYDVSGRGINFYSPDAASPASNNIVRNNIIRDITRTGATDVGCPVCGYIGIFLAVSANNNTIYNNVIWGIGRGTAGSLEGDGIRLIDAISGNKIWNNTVYGSKSKGIDIRSTGGGAINTDLRNNVAFGNTGGDYLNQGSNTSASNNLFGVDPLFVSPSARDFQLKATSPAVDAGASLSAVTTDFSGVARPQGPHPDIGAYEFRGQAAAPGPPAPPTGVRIVSN